MNASPLDLALKHISETQHLIEKLVLSSESFDYPKAKLAIKELQRKQRELATVQAVLLQQQVPSAPNVTFVSFRAAAS